MVKRTERLQGSKERRDDEYYTLFQDIADELSPYAPQLKGKRILCPCDWNENYDILLRPYGSGHAGTFADAQQDIVRRLCELIPRSEKYPSLPQSTKMAIGILQKTL